MSDRDYYDGYFYDDIDKERAIIEEAVRKEALIRDALLEDLRDRQKLRKQRTWVPPPYRVASGPSLADRIAGFLRRLVCYEEE